MEYTRERGRERERENLLTLPHCLCDCQLTHSCSSLPTWTWPQSQTRSTNQTSPVWRAREICPSPFSPSGHLHTCEAGRVWPPPALSSPIYNTMYMNMVILPVSSNAIMHPQNLVYSFDAAWTLSHSASSLKLAKIAN